MLGVKRYEVRLEPHNGEWAEQFKADKAEIGEILGDNVIAIHHIGSTSIKGIYAKPILDFGISVRDLNAINIPGMEAAGYICMGELGIPGRCYFVKRRDGDISTHHIHCFEENHWDLVNLIRFRDYLNGHPVYAKRYSDLKRELARQYASDREAYQDKKSDFIQSVLAMAKEEVENR